MTIIIVTIAFIILMIYILTVFFANKVVKPKIQDYDYSIEYTFENEPIDKEWINNVEKEEFTIDSWRGNKLHCIFIDQNSDKTIVFVHGVTWTLWGDIKYAKQFYDRGYNIMMYDHPCHGKSTGKFVSMGYFESYELKDVINWVRNKKGENQEIGIHGESMGAATVLQYGALDPDLSFIIADCPFSDLNELLKFRLKEDFKVPSFPILKLSEWYIATKYGFDFKEASPIKNLDKIKAPLLFIHGKNDTYIPCKMSEDMHKKVPKSNLFIMPNAEHAKSYTENPRKYREIVANFLDSIEK
ncbi:MAG: alpha/beta hydrolase [Thermotogota bacterium]